MTSLGQFQQDNLGKPVAPQAATPSPPVNVQPLAPAPGQTIPMPNQAAPTHAEHTGNVSGTNTGLPPGAWLGGDGGKPWSFPGGK